MTDSQLPETHYAQSGDVSIAYQVMGDGPIDLILVPGFITHIEYMHELTGFTSFMQSLGSFARVVTSIKEDRGSRIGCRARRRWKCVWTMCARFWTPSARSVLR